VCGICGQVDFSGKGPDVEMVMRVRERMRWRGPDSDGLWKDAHAVLGHRRLSIIDLSHRGDQPMLSEDGGVVMVANCEIYNYRELRKSLVEAGHRFVSESDAEVILHGYEQWGPGVSMRLEGMYAFAIWDAAAGRLLLGRDRFGEKPLFFGKRNGAYWFVSALSAILPELEGLRVRPQMLDHFMRYSYIPADVSFLEGIEKVAPGTMVSIERGGLRREEYWGPGSLSLEGRNPGLQRAAREVEARLLEIVDRRMIADVPLGVFLSGGVDSGVVAALASQKRPGVRGFHVRIPGNEEEEHARALAATLGLELHVDAVPEASWGLVEAVQDYFSEPFADPAGVTNYLVAGRAREHVKVILSGDGGDEVFAGGYGETKRQCRYEAAAHYLPGWLRRGLYHVGRLIGRRGERLARAMGGALEPPLERYRRKHDPIRRAGLRLYSRRLESDLDGWDALSMYQRAWNELEGAGALHRIMWCDMRMRLAGEYLVKVDATSMAHGLEVRCPFLDSGLVRYIFSLDPYLLVNVFAEKRLLKYLLAKRVSARHVYRRKQGFNIPTERLMGGKWGPYARRVLEGSLDMLSEWFSGDALRRICTSEWLRPGEKEAVWRMTCLALWLRGKRKSLRG